MPEVAVAPLNTIDQQDIVDQQDIGAAAAVFDKWLRQISHDYVTLERLSTVAGSLPVIGNIMALIDAIMDVVGVIQKVIAKKVLFTLYPYGPSPGNYFAGSTTVLKGGSAQECNDAVQVAHAGNTRNARPMRTQVQAFVVKEDICVAKGTALANPHLGTGGGTQYFIENGDKSKLTGGPILKFSK